MRLHRFINEGRGKILTKDNTIKLLKKHCKRAIASYNRGDILYRGSPAEGEYLYYDTSNSPPRRSRNTSNYYTYIIDNAPQWKSYPKRSMSLICTTSPVKARGYGETYNVFPYDSAPIGMVTSNDFWDGFTPMLGKGMDLNHLNWALESLFNTAMIDLNDESYYDMVESFKEFDDMIFNGPYDADDMFLKILRGSSERVGWTDGYLDTKDMLKFLQNLLAPANNGVRLLSIGDKLKCKKCECWTSYKSILVRSDLTPEIINEIS